MTSSKKSKLKAGEPVPREYANFMLSRVRPFLNPVGMSKPLEHLMAEAYRQGICDTLQVLEKYLPEKLDGKASDS